MNHTAPTTRPLEVFISHDAFPGYAEHGEDHPFIKSICQIGREMKVGSTIWHTNGGIEIEFKKGNDALCSRLIEATRRPDAPPHVVVKDPCALIDLFYLPTTRLGRG